MIGRLDEEPEWSLRVALPCRHLERPRARSELGYCNCDEEPEDAEDRRRLAARHFVGTGCGPPIVWGSAVDGRGAAAGARAVRYAAATPSVSHVIGSSKKPLYARA